jgi:hypothetical protein
MRTVLFLNSLLSSEILSDKRNTQAHGIIKMKRDGILITDTRLTHNKIQDFSSWMSKISRKLFKITISRTITMIGNNPSSSNLDQAKNGSTL